MTFVTSNNHYQSAHNNFKVGYYVIFLSIFSFAKSLTLLYFSFEKKSIVGDDAPLSCRLTLTFRSFMKQKKQMA